MARPRKQTYTMQQYLEKMQDQDIRSDQDVQRLSGAWNKNMINELIYTVLTNNYMPPIILGEEKNSQLWVIDGLQRSSSLALFRYGNYKITSSIEEPVICYRAKAKDENGNVKIDGNGDVVWKDAEFNIKNKTYDRLPEELKKRFNEYQIETVIHEGYEMNQISKLVRRYNNHQAMNAAQKAFTYVDVFAREIRRILGNKFFINNASYREKEKRNGTLERVVLESIMCMFHLDNWKRQSKKISTYLNENATTEEFEILDRNLTRLENILTDDLYSIFTSKDTYIWLTLFHKFTNSGLDDCKFAEFLTAFKDELNTVEVNSMTFYTLDENRSTKDKSVIMDKLEVLESLMCEYLHINKEDLKEVDVLDFVRENVNPDVTQEDIGLYKDMLRDFSSKVDEKSKLLDNQNQASMIAIIAYACDRDMQIDSWILDYSNRNDSYIDDQVENFQYMKCDMEEFIKLSEVA